MPRMALGISYNGRDFHGWQSQPDLPNIQDCLEQSLSLFTQHPIRVICAGRTDAGVHAFNQVVHFDSPVERPLYSWIKGVNANLPPDIRVNWSKVVADDFHARFDAVERSYLYYLRNEPVRMPVWRGIVGWEFRPLDVHKIQEAMTRLVGEHDFSSFRASECQAKSPIKHMYEACVEQHGALFIFKFRANAFLHHMVRNLIGSLLYVGQGRKPVSWISDLLDQKNRSLAAPTFMADGLYLSDVRYPDWQASDLYTEKLFGKNW
ncbi:tRNA pseudouridine(38-40) synthase TruA [Basilea psittacipulmonis]|uniref:tRNA pseudouridine synthase A n=1 Tax=Basilea psittacipulmonis DSM 24701 TaxID=1072685 RepID=A0A077DE14_9BURK|nr:tRNA pseudouridine(38-40) synthase TruA [Basilea psittacipulmonis]AIL32889.1 tRNA pseudouridine synthase A [Basilea psittacipulmonis DSM 24701]